MGRELAALAEFRNPGQIQRVEEDGGVTYRRIMLLSPGIWTDAGSRETIEYAGDAIRESADNWADREVNLLHGPGLHNATVLGDVGELVEDSFLVDDEDRLFGDIHLSGDNPASELAIELMDEVLEAAEDPQQDTPPLGPSVEISEDRTEFDTERGLEVMQEMQFSGLGLVFGPASRPVEMESQVAERAVAMADEGTDLDDDVVFRVPDSSGEATQSLKTRTRHGLSMDERNRVAKALQDVTETITELQRTLQDDDELTKVQELVAQFGSENDLGAGLEEFISFAEEAGADVDVLQDVVATFQETADVDDPTVADLQSWLEEMADGGDGEDGGEGGDGEEEAEETMTEEELESAIDTIGKFTDKIEQLDSMLAEATEEIEEREETIGDLDRRLSELEDEPDKRSLVDGAGGDFVTDADDAGDGADVAEHEDVMM